MNLFVDEREKKNNNGSAFVILAMAVGPSRVKLAAAAVVN